MSSSPAASAAAIGPWHKNRMAKIPGEYLKGRSQAIKLTNAQTQNAAILPHFYDPRTHLVFLVNSNVRNQL